ncbi:hypothetical protein IJG89_03080 [Candidatus Saccharibacteria bacterium]|nr:hypothetical protein [Candidatus Saccharibacteria bacterium]
MDYGQPTNLEADAPENSSGFSSDRPLSLERNQQEIGNRIIGATEANPSQDDTPDYSAPTEIAPSMPPGHATESASESSTQSGETGFSDVFRGGSLHPDGYKQIKDEIRATSDSGDIAGLLDKVSAHREEYIKEAKEGQG